MARGIFGWDYPPGAALDPNAPYNQVDLPCDICALLPTDCQCPECPECGEIGRAECANDHGHKALLTVGIAVPTFMTTSERKRHHPRAFLDLTTGRYKTFN